ncbi:MAG: type I restriction-modification system subunit M [Bacilli bacterium]
MEQAVKKDESLKSQELAAKLWAIANDMRGNMDAMKFKDYILGIIFYRYLSERTEVYAKDLLKDDNLTYKQAMSDSSMSETVKKWSLDTLGYVIEPDYLFGSLIDEINNVGGKTFSIDHLQKAISKLTESTIGHESEFAYDKLFDDMNLEDKDLGPDVKTRTALMSKIMSHINDISFGFEDDGFDVLGTAYMILIGNFASDAGKKGGEFFTPTCASKLLARLATSGLQRVKDVYDPCAGSGSLLLQVRNAVATKEVGHYYANELNGSTYNLLRMNLLMHGVPFKFFTTFNCDTLGPDKLYENGKVVPIQVQVSNPPFSANWNPTEATADDPRFSAAGALAPKSKADLAFVESMVYHMSDDGRIAVILPHGDLFRGNSEEQIRKYFIDKLNIIDAVIGLPANMFHGTSIPVCIIVLKKKRNGNSGNILFIDASKEFVAKKNQNMLSDEQVDKIVNTYENRKDVDKYAHVAILEEIVKNDYNLNIPRYVDTFEEEAPIDINSVISDLKKLNAEKKELDKEIAASLKELGIKYDIGE